MDVSSFNSASKVVALTPEQYFNNPDASFAMSDNLWTNLGDLLNPYKAKMKQQWENYKLSNDRAYELAKLNDARNWEYFLNSNKYSMAVADLKKAGLNPWLAVQNGISGSNSGSSTSASASSSSTSHKQDSSYGKSDSKIASTIKDLTTSALKVLMIMKIFG